MSNKIVFVFYFTEIPLRAILAGNNARQGDCWGMLLVKSERNLENSKREEQ
jgi:hypothetical protein